MFKKLRIVPLALFALAIVPSCELLGDCESCSIVTYVDGKFESETPSVVYCGEKLAEKKEAAPTIIGNTTTQWECY